MEKLEYAKDKDVFVWSIVLKENNECIGQVSIQSKDNVGDESVRDIGYFINPKYQRCGYMYEAISKVLEYMFYEVGITKIDTGAAVDSIASWKLMEKLGFGRKNGDNVIYYYTFGGDKEGYSYLLTKFDYFKKMRKEYEKEILNYKKKFVDLYKEMLDYKEISYQDIDSFEGLGALVSINYPQYSDRIILLSNSLMNPDDTYKDVITNMRSVYLGMSKHYMEESDYREDMWEF